MNCENKGGKMREKPEGSGRWRCVAASIGQHGVVVEGLGEGERKKSSVGGEKWLQGLANGQTKVNSNFNNIPCAWHGIKTCTYTFLEKKEDHSGKFQISSIGKRLHLGSSIGTQNYMKRLNNKDERKKLSNCTHGNKKMHCTYIKYKRGCHENV